MDFRIPTSFSIGGELFTVSFVENCTEKDSAVDGQAAYSRGKIEIKTNPKETEEYKEFVFLHELVHVLCYAIEEDKLRTNEAFTSRLARALHQVVKTATFSDSTTEGERK